MELVSPGRDLAPGTQVQPFFKALQVALARVGVSVFLLHHIPST
jgi:hypothetical protein